MKKGTFGALGLLSGLGLKDLAPEGEWGKGKVEEIVFILLS